MGSQAMLAALEDVVQRALTDYRTTAKQSEEDREQRDRVEAERRLNEQKKNYDLLINALNDQDETIQLSAISSLGNWGNQRTIEVLKSIWKNENTRRFGKPPFSAYDDRKLDAVKATLNRISQESFREAKSEVEGQEREFIKHNIQTNHALSDLARTYKIAISMEKPQYYPRSFMVDQRIADSLCCPFCLCGRDRIEILGWEDYEYQGETYKTIVVKCSYCTRYTTFHHRSGEYREPT